MPCTHTPEINDMHRGVCDKSSDISYSGARQRRLGRTADFFMIAYIGIGYNRKVS